MTIIEEIYAALLLAKPDDLREVEKYIKWIIFRRQVNRRFYFSAHWIRGPRRPHWVGRHTDINLERNIVRKSE